ncbi:hypothetical protein K1T71_013834 [Dendrolimus kikuchii]|uniref:Uncharacterized protein n=1 Tax=Dendrolimus kikuchii TaxID=765133 RepID=A0ACC1CFV1_9NEOP|nr:hypothetical protein K1T71_013834 [Dendrolimus kikuchii]
MSSTLNIDDNIELITLKARQDSLFGVLQLIYKKSLQAFDSTECLQCFQGYAATLDNIRTQFKDTANKYNEVLLMTMPDAVPDYEAMIPFEELFCKIKAVLRRVNIRQTSLDCNNNHTVLRLLAAVPSTSIMQSSVHHDVSSLPHSFVDSDYISIYHDVNFPFYNSHVILNEKISSSSMAPCSHDDENYTQPAFHLPASISAVLSKSLSSSTLYTSNNNQSLQSRVNNATPASSDVANPHHISYNVSVTSMNSEISSVDNSDDDNNATHDSQDVYYRASLLPITANSLLKSILSGPLIKRHCGFKSNYYKLPRNTLLIKGKYKMSFEDIADIRLSRFNNSNPLAYTMFNLPALLKYSLLQRFLSPNMVYNNFNILHPAVRTVLGYDISSPATFKIPHGSFINYNLFAQVCLTLLLRTLWNLKKNIASLPNIEYYHLHDDYRRKVSALIYFPRHTNLDQNKTSLKIRILLGSNYQYNIALCLSDILLSNHSLNTSNDVLIKKCSMGIILRAIPAHDKIFKHNSCFKFNEHTLHFSLRQILCRIAPHPMCFLRSRD